MPYGGNDWLDLNQEETIEPELPICDPHHHFWDLRSERTPYGRYLLHELVDDLSAVENDNEKKKTHKDRKESSTLFDNVTQCMKKLKF